MATEVRPIYADKIICPLCGTYPNQITAYFETATASFVTRIQCHDKLICIYVPRSKLIDGDSLHKFVQQEFNQAVGLNLPIEKPRTVQVDQPDIDLSKKPTRKIDLE